MYDVTIDILSGDIMIFPTPIEFVSCSMGHSTVATTQKYYANYRDSFVNSKIFDMIGQ